MKTYSIYHYLTLDTLIAPCQYKIPPQQIDPKKELIIRPCEDIVMEASGEISLIIYWDSPQRNVKLYQEEITYQRDQDGTRTKNLAMNQTKKLSWFFNPSDGQEQLLDEVNTKTLIKPYDTFQVSDSLEVLLPTAEQLMEWKRKASNQIHYIITKEIAGTLVDQGIFQLFDNLLEEINKWKENPISTAFKDAILNKTAGFNISTPTLDASGQVMLDAQNQPIMQSINIWDAIVNAEEQTLQAFLHERIVGEVL